MQPTPATHQANPTKFIDDNQSLQQSLLDLKSHDTLAFDLEFDSHRNAYGVNLCLIQVASPATCYVIDPLADISLDGLYAIFEDPSIQKIVHSPGEDLRLLHSLGCYPQNVFDTEVVAKLLNYEQTSLSSMLQAKLGYSLDKGQQRSNWLRRPLSPEQIRYAADDVFGLHELKKVLLDEAEPKGLLPFIEEEQAALTTTIHVSERKDSFLKQGDLANLSPYDQFILNSLFLFRDELARSLNRPAFQVMDETIVRSLASAEMYPDELVNAKGVYGGYKNTRFANQLADKLDDFHAEAQRQKLSKSRPPRQYNGDGRNSRSLMADQKEALFTPIQQALTDRFGEFAARFILSNGAVNDILKGTQKISTLKRQYKQALIKEIAHQQGLDLSPYL